MLKQSKTLTQLALRVCVEYSPVELIDKLKKNTHTHTHRVIFT